MSLLTLNHLKFKFYFNFYVDKISSKVLKGEWGCNKEPWVWHQKFNHPKIPRKNFEEDFDFYDWGEENKECTIEK